MLDQKEAYHYRTYLPKLDGATLRVVPGFEYARAYHPRKNTPYTMADAFMETINNSQNKANFEDFFNQKVELSRDRTGLILDEISGRDSLKCDNLTRLYDDLLRINNWRLQRPYPLNYATDRTWTDLNKMQLQIHDQIRREMKDFARDTSFPQKDLRESLLEYKVQNQKSEMLNIGDLEKQIEGGGIEPDGSDQQKGDSYQPQPPY